MGDGDEWITLGEAAKRLGVTRAAVYGRVKRGTLQTKARGNRGLLVSWPPPNDPLPSPQRHGDGKGDVTATVAGDVTHDVALVAELRSRLEAMTVEREALLEAGDHLVDQLAEARERAARVEGELKGLRQASHSEALVLREALVDLSSRLDRATDELRDLRRPWWRRLIG